MRTHTRPRPARTLHDHRFRNPFHGPLVTEIIEDPVLYKKLFSEKILVGETLSVFRELNVVLTGPQGSGKSMILNLVRYQTIAQWLAANGTLPSPLNQVSPFFGISVNLARITFYAFGRRSVSLAAPGGVRDDAKDLASASDFLNHYLFGQFLRGLVFFSTEGGARLARWLKISSSVSEAEIVDAVRDWDVWFGYYSDCKSYQDLIDKSDKRLNVWRSFLNSNIEKVPDDVWMSKTTLGEPLHKMGNLLRTITPKSSPVPLFVVIDQYEVLPELNPTHGTSLQRVVNTLVKARDPVVFIKVGARTYDWGKELRVWGADSRIEVQRDYTIIDLADILTRDEDGHTPFPELASDIAYKRLIVRGHYKAAQSSLPNALGVRTSDEEARIYFPHSEVAAHDRRYNVLGGISGAVVARIIELCGPDPSPLDLRLASAWTLQAIQRGNPQEDIVSRLSHFPWRQQWWRKERVEIALLQIASMANQRRRYYGWHTVLTLAGANITALLLICAEIWDIAARLGVNPIAGPMIDANIQSEGIYSASELWRIRDREDPRGGSFRYHAIGRLGPAIHDAVVEDLAISNPGHSGFSLRESDIGSSSASLRATEVGDFLRNAVSWAILVERKHTSKLRESAIRRKWYLHPILAPAFGTPTTRVKEPLYTTVEQVYAWLFGSETIRFVPRKSRRGRDRATDIGGQISLPIPEE